MTQKNPTPSDGRWDADGATLWEFVSARGMDRRQFLGLMVAGGAAAVLAACVGTEPPTETPRPTQTAAVSAQIRTRLGSRTLLPSSSATARAWRRGWRTCRASSRPPATSLSVTTPSALTWTRGLETLRGRGRCCGADGTDLRRHPQPAQ